jgi:RNA polymerase sigma-70 factor, ECF subfamily
MKAPLPANLLLQALAAGDPQAYAALYDRLGARLLRVARAMLRDRQNAEDAVQDVFVGLVKSRQRLLLVQDLDAYVFAMLRHGISQRLRQSQMERHQLTLLAMALPPTAPAPVENDPDLDRALQELPAEQREVIALKIDGDLTFAQIAQVLGISPNTAASRYRYALEKLRRML